MVSSSNALLWWQRWLWAHAILCNQLMKMHSRLTGSNRQHFIPFPGNVGLQPLRHWPWAVSSKAGVKVPQQLLLQIIWRKPLDSRDILQNGASCNRCGTDHGPFRLFDAQLDVTLTPALGVSTSQVLCLCMRFGNQTATTYCSATFNIGVQCRICNVRLKSFLKKCNVRIMKCLHNFIFYQSIILETNSRQNCFASSMLPSLLAYVGIKTWKETNMPSGHSLPWRPPKHHTLKGFQACKTKTNKKWCAKYSSNAPLWWQGWLWAHAILCNQFVKIRSRVAGSNRQHFIPLPGNLGLQPLRHWPWAVSSKAGVTVTFRSASKGPWWVPQQLLLQIIWRKPLDRKAPLQRYSPERRQLQPLRHWPWAVSAFWCPAPRHYAQSWRESHASFGRKDVASPLPLHGVLETRQRLLTATDNIGVQCQKYNVRLKSYLKKGNVRIMKCLHNFIFTTLSSLKKIQDKTALHLQCCQVCWHMLASRLEGNKHVLHMDRSTACLLATLSHGSLRNATLSKVFKHSQEDRRKNASIVLAMMY